MEMIYGNEMIYIVILNDHDRVCKSCTIYIVLFVITFIIIISIGNVYFYFYWYSKKDHISMSLY